MQRKYEFMDLIVMIGLCATIVGAGLMFMVANGTWQGRSMASASLRPALESFAGRYWIQPILGRTIVDQYLSERRHSTVASAALAELERLGIERKRWQNSPFGYLDPIVAGAARAEPAQVARVQAVMGRSIVDFTRRGVRSGMGSSGEGADLYNARMIGATEAMGEKMGADFAETWQPSLGRAIVTAGQERADAFARMQERAGRAIVTLGTADVLYGRVRGVIQERLGGAIVSAALTERQANQFDQATSARSAAQQPLNQAGERRAWPEISNRYVVVAAMGLMGAFMAGLLLLGPPPLRRVVDA